MNRLIITATGTDVGKTYVTGLIAKKMYEYGLECGYYKPALSGAYIDANGRMVAGDAEYVCKAGNIDIINASDTVSYIYRTPVSPHLASRIEGNMIDFERLKGDYDTAKARYDYLLVEGCGGIMCPLNLDTDTVMLHELMGYMDENTIIVCDSGLGTINSTLLTVEFAVSRGIKIKGIIMNNYEQDNYLHEDNLRVIERLSGIPVLSRVASGDEDINIDRESLLSWFGE